MCIPMLGCRIELPVPTVVVKIAVTELERIISLHRVRCEENKPLGRRKNCSAAGKMVLDNHVHIH